ncbi:MAG: glycosyltransferase family 39 protein [Bacteroidetes bacterium]|nr:glycosyltransferase family 39 protein [Bacteroidota bacterium]
MKKNYEEKIIFASIILIASVLRFWNYWNWSYTHDELGALMRLNYYSFSELIREGIQNGDTHPAFVQIFLYVWTKIFGLSEEAVRFPFVLAGIGSVALVYLIAKKWFGFTAACFSSLTIAILDFPILYSQLARPYSFGLFFSLLAAWCWTNLLFGYGKKLFLKAIFYGIATALCMFAHYFAFFFAMLVAVTGLFFLKRETWKPFLLAGVIALILFLPHLSVSLHQFSKGGVGEWLAKPEKDFLWKFILYGFNESPFVLISAVIVSLLSLTLYHLDFSISKFHFVCIAWFILPFMAGYYYSIHVNPVLQYSTLLFSFPFLSIFLFSFFKDRKEKTNNYLFISTGIILLYSTVVEQKFYKREVFGVFKEINRAVIDLQEEYGAGQITTVLNTSDKNIFDFYFQQWNKKIPFDFFAGDSPDFVSQMLNKIDSCQTPYFLYGWSNFRSPYEIPELIKRKFPCIVYYEKHFNSQVTLFGKNDSCRRDTIFYSQSGFEKEKRKSFEFDSTKIDSLHFHSGKHSLNIESKNEFCITLKTSVSTIFSENNIVNISAWIFPKDSFNAQIVIDIGDGKSREWRAILLKPFVKTSGKWQEVFASFEVPASAFPDDEVKIYLWNPGKNSFYVDDFTVTSFKDSKYNYYETSYRK